MLNLLNTIIAMDFRPIEMSIYQKGFRHVPFAKIISYCQARGLTVLETLVTLIQNVPEDDSPETFARMTLAYERKKFALETCGARVLDCPAKPSSNSPSGYKQCDDATLVAETMVRCLKWGAGTLVLLGGDGDFAPMVRALRGVGIRTIVIAPMHMLASDLRRHAAEVIDIDVLLDDIVPPVFADAAYPQALSTQAQ